MTNKYQEEVSQDHSREEESTQIISNNSPGKSEASSGKKDKIM